MKAAPSPPEPCLNLIVIRSAIPADLAAFYTRLGCSFAQHQHGNGPWHYAAELGALTLEIYPLKRSQSAPDSHLRLGFMVPDVSTAIAQLAAPVLSGPTASDWGLRAVIQDPEGRRVELVQH